MQNVTREQAICLAHELQVLLRKQRIVVYLFGNAVAHDTAQEEKYVHLLFEVTFDQYDRYLGECYVAKRVSGWFHHHAHDCQRVSWEKSDFGRMRRIPSVIRAIGMDMTIMEDIFRVNGLSLDTQCEIICLPCDWRQIVSIEAGGRPPVLFGYNTDKLTDIMCEAICASALP